MRSTISAIVFMIFVSSCSSEDTQFYEAEEASQLIFAAYVAKNMECDKNLGPNILIPSRARKEHVDACVSSIMSSECDQYEDGDSYPACLSIQLDLK